MTISNSIFVFIVGMIVWVLEGCSDPIENQSIQQPLIAGDNSTYKMEVYQFKMKNEKPL
jgi:hypothetical protein